MEWFDRARTIVVKFTEIGVTDDLANNVVALLSEGTW